MLTAPGIDKHGVGGVMLACEAMVTMACVHGLLAFVPVRRLVPYVGRQCCHELDTVADRRSVAEAKRIAWIISAVARRLPRRPRCLTQAVAAKLMLSRRNVPSTLVFGVCRDGPETTHAWLRVGDIVVTGGARVSRYSVIASFA